MGKYSTRASYARIKKVASNGQPAHALELDMVLCSHCAFRAELFAHLAGVSLAEFVANAISAEVERLEGEFKQFIEEQE